LLIPATSVSGSDVPICNLLFQHFLQILVDCVKIVELLSQTYGHIKVGLEQVRVHVNTVVVQFDFVDITGDRLKVVGHLA